MIRVSGIQDEKEWKVSSLAISESDIDTPRRLFERIVLRRGSLRGLGQQCGRSPMWIWRQLRQNKGIDLMKTARVLHLLQVPLRYFYEEILAEAPEYDPTWLLLHFREGSPERQRDPFLASRHYRFHRLAEEPFGVAPAPPREHGDVTEFENLSLSDPVSAKNRLEQSGREILLSAEAAASRQSLHRRHLADCAHLLLSWGSFQHASGHRDDATDAYVLAYPLAAKSGDRRALGLFFFRAANLLREWGQTNQALRFGEDSCRLFRGLRSSRWLAAALVQRALVLADLQRFRESRVEALLALRVASRDGGARATAWLHLGSLAIARGEPRKALGRLARAEASARSAELKGFVHWRQAIALGDLQRWPEAAVFCRRAIVHFEAGGQKLAAAWVTLDLAELSMRQGGFAETTDLVKASSPRFESLSNRQAFGLWMDLCALLLGGSKKRSLEHLAKLRQALKEAEPEIRVEP